MLRRALRHPLPLAITLSGVVAAVALGLWQLQRLEWKTALLAEIDNRLASAPVTFADSIPGRNIPDWTPVTAKGIYDHAHEIRLFASGASGGGWFILTPLLLKDGTAILVNRGFIPSDSGAVITRPSGLATVAGIVKRPAASGLFAPDNQPSRGLWYHPDLKAMRGAAGHPLAPYLLVSAPAKGTEGWPQPQPIRPEIPNRHLEYALTWFGFAVTLAVIFLLWLRRQED